MIVSAPEFFTTKQIASKMGVSDRLVRRWCQKGLLKCLRVGAIIRVTPADYDEFKRRHYGKAVPA